MSVFHVGQSLLAAQGTCEKLNALNVPHSCHYIPACPSAPELLRSAQRDLGQFYHLWTLL